MLWATIYKSGLGCRSRLVRLGRQPLAWMYTMINSIRTTNAVDRDGYVREASDELSLSNLYRLSRSVWFFSRCTRAVAVNRIPRLQCKSCASTTKLRYRVGSWTYDACLGICGGCVVRLLLTTNAISMFIGIEVTTITLILDANLQ